MRAESPPGPSALTSTPLYGRTAELSELEALWVGGARLITVWGAAGVGKTHLVDAAVAHPQMGGMPPVQVSRRSPAQLLESAAGDEAAAIRALTSPVETLLVVHGVDAHAAALAPQLSRWLEAVPGLRVLVSSRERLCVRQERTLELGPLPLPDEDGDLLETPAAELLAARIRWRHPEFTLDGETRGAFIELLRLLDGLPLAMELAAARIELLGLQGLVAQLRARRDVLTGGARDAEPHHESLRGAIDASWRQLNTAQRDALMCCAVFSGTFDLEGAEALIGERHAVPVLELLQGLRDRSLLRVTSLACGETRYSLLRSIRDFGLSQLDDEQPRELTELQQRHGAFFLQRARALHATWTRGRGGDALRRMASERENCMAAVRGAVARAEAGDASAADSALSLLVALSPLVLARGPLAQTRSLVERTLQALEDSGERALLARGHRLLGQLLRCLGQHAESRTALERALELLEGLEGTEDAALAIEAELHVDLGTAHHQRRELELALAAYRTALALQRRLADPRAEGRILGNIGALHHDARRFEAAQLHYEQALAKVGEAGDARLTGVFLSNRGLLRLESGQSVAAAEDLERACRLLGEVGDRRLAGIARSNLGMLLHEDGQLRPALEAHREALGILEAVGDRRSTGLCHARLAGALAATGDIEAAQRHFDAAEALLQPLRNPLVLEASRLGRAFVDVARCREAYAEDRPDRAERLLRRAEQRIAEAQRPLDAGGLAVTEVVDDARIMLRMLRDQLSDLAGEAEVTDALLVAPGARRFRVPGGDWQDFSRRVAVRRVLLALIRHRERFPGEALDAARLFDAGWPDTPIPAASADNRLNVALATLRKCGLKGRLLHQDGGYLLSAGLRVRWHRDQSGEAGSFK